MKKILIAGAHSYIGASFRQYLNQFPDRYEAEEIETKAFKPKPEIFEGYNVVFCVAGIAHIKESSDNSHLYYEVNRDLVVAMARAAKIAGVRQFILLSSMSVYGLTVGHITKSMKPHPINNYGKSKLQADEEIRRMADEDFIFACLRPPMVYGKGCPGNYQILRKFSLKSPFFPDYQNQRSMIYIGNLCEFVKLTIDLERSGLFFPQNDVYTNTCEMVGLIAAEHGKRIKLTKIFNWAFKGMQPEVVRKVLGNLTYEFVDTVSKYSFRESISLTEGERF